jgi:hypothetical protein
MQCCIRRNANHSDCVVLFCNGSGNMAEKTRNKGRFELSKQNQNNSSGQPE